MNKLVLLSAVVLLSSVRLQAFDEEFYYCLSTNFEGDQRVLDIVNDGKMNSKPVMADKEDVSGQYWKLTPVDDGFYRLTTLWRGGEYSLDIINDGTHNNRPMLTQTGNYDGQLWKITPNGEGYYRLTTAWRGEQYSLDVYNEADTHSRFLILAPTEDVSGQQWKFTKTSKFAK